MRKPKLSVSGKVGKGKSFFSDKLAEHLKKEGRRLLFVEGKIDKSILQSVSYFQSVRNLRKNADSQEGFVIFFDDELPEEWQEAIIEKEAAHLNETGEEALSPREINRLLDDLVAKKERKADLSISSVIIPERKVSEGILVECTSVVWARMLEEIENDWTKVFDIDPHVWEQIIAGAFAKSGFDQVIITPRSGDHGRDIIAIKSGLGSIRILGSVKRYKPGHLVTKEEVHALMGAVSLGHRLIKAHPNSN